MSVANQFDLARAEILDRYVLPFSSGVFLTGTELPSGTQPFSV